MPLFGSTNVQKLIDKRDLRRLSNALSDNDPSVRDHAAQGLVQLGDAGCVPSVVDVLLAHQQQDGVLDAGIGVLRGLASDAVPSLVVGLRSGPPDKRAGYAALLGRLGPQYGLEPLLEASHDPDGAMRAVAAMGLGLVEAPPAAARLAEIVEADESMEARGYAGFAMATHHVAGAYETLVAQLDSDDPASRGVAASNLGILGDSRAAERLGQLAEQDGDQRVRDAARGALGSLG